MSVEFTKGPLNKSARAENFDSDQFSGSVELDYRRFGVASPSSMSMTPDCADADCLECFNQAQLYTQQVGYSSGRKGGSSGLDNCFPYLGMSQPPPSYRNLLTATKSDSLDREVDVARTSKKVGFTQERVSQSNAPSGPSPDPWPIRSGSNGSCDKVFCDSQSSCDYCLHLAGKTSTNSNCTSYNQDSPTTTLDSNYLRTDRLSLQEASTMTDQVNNSASLDAPAHIARLTRYYHKLVVAKIRRIVHANKPVVMAIGPFFKLCVILISVNLMLRVLNGLSNYLIDMLRGERSQNQPVETSANSGPTEGLV